MTAVDSERRFETVPVAWGKDALTGFFETARSNQIATFANKSVESAKLVEIDDCFVKISGNLLNPKTLIAPFFLLRSHASFRGAAGFAMAGQVAEAFVMTRSGLEHASYGLLIANDMSLAETWLRRHDDENALKKARKSLDHRSLVNSIAAKDQKLAKLYGKLYQDAIDFGAHPNERAITGNMKMTEELDQVRWEQTYLHGDSLALNHALKHTAQAGLCCLHIFGHIFAERFMLLGLISRIQELRKGL
jgi:hypothetical protein